MHEFRRWKGYDLDNPNDRWATLRSIGPDLSRSYSSYKRSARLRGYSFNLTPEQFAKICEQPCHYCGDLDDYNGIDRKDNNIGYELENCLPCCTTCNYAKHELGYDEFIRLCRKILKHLTRSVIDTHTLPLFPDVPS